MELKTSIRNDVGIIQMIGQFWEPRDQSMLRRHIDTFLDTTARYVILDMSRLTFISSQALGQIVTAFREVREKGGELLVLSASGSVGEVMELSGFEHFLRIFDTQAELEKYLSK